MSASTTAKGVGLATGTFASNLAGGNSILALGPAVVKDALTIQAKYVGPTPTSGVLPTAGSSWTFYGGSTTGGGLNAGQLQAYLYEDPAYGPQIQQWLQAYSAVVVAGAVGPPVVPTTSRVVCRIVSSAPLDWVGGYPVAGAGSANLMGSFVGTGAAQVVPCVGISTNASIRYYLLGATIAAFAAGIAAPTAVSVQANASFTITATLGAIYGYEVLNA